MQNTVVDTLLALNDSTRSTGSTSMAQRTYQGNSRSRSVAAVPFRPAQADSAPERSARTTRFVTESHTLGTQIADPASLIVAAAIAVALYMVGRRIAG